MPPVPPSSAALDDDAARGLREAGDDEIDPDRARPDRGGGRGPRPPERRREVVRAAGLLGLLFAPLVVALAVLRRPQWFPILDLAMTELRVRDVGTGDTPLIGLPGRIGQLGPDQGSHPGPLSFWLLAPAYRLFGSSAWAMEVAAVCLHAAAAGVALWIAHRRAGMRLVLGLAAVLAILLRGYGTATLTEPWNPYMPVLWWIVVVLGVWSVLDRDLPMLPVAAFAASLCAQTHAPYLGLAGGMGAVALVAVVIAFVVRGDRGDRRQALGWSLATVGVVAVLWLPPVIDQLTNDPGNIDRLVDHFGSPPEDPVGIRRGGELVLHHLDVWRLLTEKPAARVSLVDASRAPVGSLVPGALLLLAWLGSVAVAWRLRLRTLLRLDAVLGVGLVLAAVSISRIFGQLWYYLMLWAWGLTALVVLAVGWAVAEAVGRRLDRSARGRGVRLGATALVVVTVVSSAAFTVRATEAEVPAVELSDMLRSLVPDTVAALEAGEGAAAGRDGRYLVTWTDALHIGAQGMALLNELDRQGFDVGALDAWGVPSTRHRVMEPEDADAVVHLANGAFVEEWRARPGVTEVAFVEPRTPEEREEYSRLRTEVIADLRRIGLDERVPDVDGNLFAAAIDTRVPGPTQDLMTRMLELGSPTAVFVGPPSALG